MNILAIGAHPDDLEFGCAGALVKYSQKNHKVYLMILTGGELGGEKSVRKKEQIVASKIIGAAKIFWGEYEDTKLPLNRDLILSIEKCIREIKPNFIFVNYYQDTHQDHRNLTLATLSATRYIRNVLFYEVPTTQNFTPNVFIDIKNVIKTKKKALKAHQSQVLKTNIQDLSITEVMISTANYRGVQGRVAYAEGFMSERLFINIE